MTASACSPTGTRTGSRSTRSSSSGCDRGARCDRGSASDRARLDSLRCIVSSSRTAPDDELARRAQAGDRDALDQLLRRHHDRLFALCRRLAGNHADALDATQEALITIARRIDRFDGRSSFGTWAYRVATNACLDELRRRKRRPDPVDLDGRPDVHQGRGPLHVAAPIDHAALIADRELLDAALAKLPEDFRVAVVLRDVLTMDYAEIAATVGVPIGTVRSRIARGRSLLAKQLVAAGNPPRRAERPSLDDRSGG